MVNNPGSYPLVKEIDYVDPIAVFGTISQNNAIFLDSVCQDNQGRYSFIGLDPFLMMTCHGHEVTLGENTFTGHPFEILNKYLKKYSLPRLKDLPPFQGGMAGMLGYELGSYLENLPISQKDDLQFPELIVGFYDVVIAWDHQEKSTFIFSSGYPEFQTNQRLARAQHRLDWAQTLVTAPLSLSPLLKIPVFGILAQPIVSTFNEETYQEAVKQVIEYILAGDIFEANISQRFLTKRSAILPFELYRVLRHHNPAPFSAFMQHQDWVVASASPERFLKLTQQAVQARPIKGTRPRHPDPLQDEVNAKALLASEKDKAENIMIVDLMRNDLSRVCKAGSIKVTQLCGLETFASVHHLVSVVQGTLSPEKNAIDLLKSTFPGGSITGAPKIRAMEIIAQIEPTVRGPYCGSMGYIAFNGDMDFSITIRTILMNKALLSFQTGGAVTLGSDPLEEYEETLTKAKVLRDILVGES